VDSPLSVGLFVSLFLYKVVCLFDYFDVGQNASERFSYGVNDIILAKNNVNRVM